MRADYGYYIHLPLRYLVMRGWLHSTICNEMSESLFGVDIISCLLYIAIKIEWHSGKYHLLYCIFTIFRGVFLLKGGVLCRIKS